MSKLACQGAMGFLLGHRFEARYSEGKPAITFTSIRSADADGLVKIIESSKSRIYVCSVCGRCGLTLKEPT